MAEEKAALRKIHWRQICPWLAIFRAFSIAIDPKKLFLGALGVLALSTGWTLIAGLFALVGAESVSAQADEVRHWPWERSQWHRFEVATDPAVLELIDDIERRKLLTLTQADRARLNESYDVTRGVDIIEETVRSPHRVIPQLATNWRFVLRPIIELKRPFQGLFSSDFSFVQCVFALACGLWAVVVWAVFGGAITRIAAVQFASEEKISMMEALRFATGKFLSYAGAPVIPLIFIAIIVVPCFLGGLISALLAWFGLPGGGAIFAGLLWVLPLLAAFAMAIIAIMWAIGWPLMFSTISAEGSDSFDALSRSYAYAFQRPWHYLFYALLAAVFGSLCSFFVLLFADLLVHTAQWAVSWGDVWLGQLPTLLKQMFYYAPEASGWAPTLSAEEAPTGATLVGAVFTGAWLYVVFMLLVGFVYSYFWSASTVIYFLLRRDVDNTELQEVYVEGAEDEFDMPTGVPATPLVTPSDSPAPTS
jgi:hypothetical protein